MTNTVSYNLVTDIDYIITAIINLHHNSVILILISVSYQGKCTTDVIWTVLYRFLGIGVVLVMPVFPQDGRFVYHRVGVVCLETDKTQCLYMREVMRASKWREKMKNRFTGLSAFQLIPYRAETNEICDMNALVWSIRAISVTNENDLQLSSIMEEMSTESVANIP